MTIIRTTTDKRQTLPTMTGTACLSSLNSYSSVCVERVVIDKLPKEQRTKPTDVLANLTAREEQKRALYRPSTAIQVRTVVDRCGSGWPAYVTFYQYQLMDYLNVMSNLPTADWALALRNKIQDDKVSFADSIGEWREAVGLVHDASSLLIKCFRAAKRLLKVRRGRKRLKGWFKQTFNRSPESRLELQDAVTVDLMIKFGIKPTCDLAWDSLQALDTILARKRRIQVTLPAEDELIFEADVGRAVLKRKVSYRAVAYVTYNVDDPSFTAGNLGEALWAGTRLSFMVDWFWNFGSYLSSFNALQGVQFYRCSVGRRVTITGVDRRANVGYKVTVPGRMTHRSFKRDVVNTLPYASIPTLKLPDSDLWQRLLSSIEVLSTFRKRH